MSCMSSSAPAGRPRKSQPLCDSRKRTFMIEILAAGATQNLPISLLAILALGFFLGMRHATDADHVVAVSTIVSRERSVANAALIGALWGAGHTLTILAVGTAIIVFSFVVSPRLGLTMELSVGLMLMLLGALNIFGFRQSVQEYAHVHSSSEHPHSHSTQESQLTWSRALAESTHRHNISFGPLDRFCGSLTLYQMCRPLLIGIVHGLAGSAAVALL